MSSTDQELKNLLLASGKVKAGDLKTLESSGKPLAEAVLAKKLLSEHELAQLFAKALDLPYVDLEKQAVPARLMSRLTPELAQKHQAVPFKAQGGHVHVAMAEPGNTAAVAAVKDRLGTKVKLHVANPSAVTKALKQPTGETVAPTQPANPSSHDLSAAGITKTLNLILEYALKTRANAIHIEPGTDHAAVRYRIDGVLHEAVQLPAPILPAVVAKLASMASLDQPSDRPLEGNFSFKHQGATMNVDLTILPLVNGVKVVMLLADPNAQPPKLEELGLTNDNLDTIKKELERAHGLIIVTGPVGSGVTTTLYALILALSAGGATPSTIETSVNLHLLGVNQTEVGHERGAVAAGLKALLRQEPGTIMLSSLSDNDTADLATEAALKGRLVLGGLQATSAAEAVSQLLNMGLEPYLVASSVNSVIGERLVRRLCPNCRVQYQPTANELAELEKADSGGNLLDDEHHELKLQPLHDLSQDNSILAQIARDPNLVDRPAGSPQLSTAPVPPTTAVSPDGRSFFGPGPGCSQCGPTGYSGQIGIFEVMKIDDGVQKVIAAGGSVGDIQLAAIKTGMKTLRQDGIAKATQGLTSLAEIERVTQS